MQTQTAALELTPDSFAAEVLQESLLALVGVYHDGAAAARLGGELRQIGEENPARVKCCLLDAARFPATASEYGLNRAPGFLLFSNGEVVERVEGPAPLLLLRTLISRHS